ncbi:uncharacterized protein LOC124844135 isoform X1 [Vigna umbellata]|uniref:PB1 domain-containing protein n=1 Tax=Vigna angularis var. angularis TaxID=157739 RepID=A0A0S3S1L2_PHAAN|nr:uncharacterized protein LOC108330769 isoform X1 [Vigna angularis]XP_047176966.1 uncharacterized protein LOC124844135 isoform X1 [Vigna umbellata]BAT86722.1 hypothetical protein VIGAN_05002500 [Vigna angularis var. angularis]
MGDDSPKNKVKFLCSYAGKVLPRPSDGILRYVGGETRVVSVPRDVTFSELMKKVGSMVEGEVVLKYQLVPEDLDALVSVRTEEDVKHMIQEHDRHHIGLLRAFLFPSNKMCLAASETYPLEQRYIDAVNGILRTSPKATTRGSACSSPKSISPDAGDQYSPRFGNSISISSAMQMQRVRSSPSLSNMDQQAHYHQHSHLPFHNYPSFSTTRPPQDPQITRLGGRGASFNHHHSNPRQPPRGLGPYGYPDDSATYGNALHNIPRSPRRKSIWE